MKRVDITASRMAREMIKEHEGYRGKAYQCPAGKWTLGYGFTYIPEGGGHRPVVQGETCNRKQAEKWLTAEIMNNLLLLREEKKDGKPVVRDSANSEERAVIVSLMFNVGFGNVLKSRFLEAFNRGDYGRAEKEFKEFRKSNGRILPGLVNRRAKEWDFLVSGYKPPAPDCILEARRPWWWRLFIRGT